MYANCENLCAGCGHATVTPAKAGVQSVPRLAGLVGQAFCLSLNDGQDARPTEEGIASSRRLHNDGLKPCPHYPTEPLTSHTAEVTAG
jgi:hypothetical protein